MVPSPLSPFFGPEYNGIGGVRQGKRRPIMLHGILTSEVEQECGKATFSCTPNPQVLLSKG